MEWKESAGEGEGRERERGGGEAEKGDGERRKKEEGLRGNTRADGQDDAAGGVVECGSGSSFNAWWK